jgi:hypothetical protein
VSAVKKYRLTKKQVDLLQAAANNDGKVNTNERNWPDALSLAKRGLGQIGWRAGAGGGNSMYLTLEGRIALWAIPGSAPGSCVGGTQDRRYSTSCPCDRCRVFYGTTRSGKPSPLGEDTQ